MKKLIFVVLASFLVVPAQRVVFAQTQDQYVKTIYSIVNVYEQAHHTSQILQTYAYGTKLKLKNTQMVNGTDNLTYYLVEITEQETQGYILCNHVLNVENSSPKKVLETNAKLKENAILYTLKGSQFEETPTTLNSGTKIKVIGGYDSDNQFTQIQYKDENGDILTTYVKTSTIKTSQVSKGIIAAIVLIASTVSLVLVILGINGKKKKQKHSK